MPSSQRRTRIAAWLCALVLAFAAVAPVVSRCLASSAGAAMAHQGHEHTRSKPVVHLDYCGYCVLHCAGFTPLAIERVQLILAELAFCLLLPSVRIAVRAEIRRRPSSRAPPAQHSA